MTTNEMIKRVAQAIYEASPHNKPYSLLTAFQREKCEREARAAIEAIREPTTEMLVAPEMREWAWRTDEGVQPEEIADAWRSMIDAALADPLPVFDRLTED